jgi:hypothetical protein
MNPNLTDRFSEATREALRHHEDELADFGTRVGHLLSVQQELVQVTRGMSFLAYHLRMWQMLLSERDMVIVDLASWALHFYKKGDGGFLRALQGQI